MSDDSAIPQDSDEAPSPVPDGPKGVVILGALIGSVVIGVAAGLFAVGPMVAKKSGFAVTDAHAAADSAGAGDSSDAGDADAREDGETSVNVHLIDNLVLNPAGSGGSRFLMLAAAIEFQDAALIDEIKSRDAEARDIILRVLGSKRVEQLAEMSLRDTLKAQLGDSLGTLFRKPKQIRRVYFPQFVLQ